MNKLIDKNRVARTGKMLIKHKGVTGDIICVKLEIYEAMNM